MKYLGIKVFYKNNIDTSSEFEDFCKNNYIVKILETDLTVIVVYR